MKKIIILSTIILIGLLWNSVMWAQSIPHNGAPASLEHNVLFNAVQRYQVSQSGPATFGLSSLFDGVFRPLYPKVGPSDDAPHTILIENLPLVHRQRGAWIGWTTRYWYAQKFEIWGYENYYNNGWIKIAEESAYTSNHYLKILPSGGFTKFKFIFYKASGTSGRMGLSEIYYIHPEATRPYEGLIPYTRSDLCNLLASLQGSDCDSWSGESIPNNGQPVSLEHNVLFRADLRFAVSQSGPATFGLSSLFDGVFRPLYPKVGPSDDAPHTILIENLPLVHRQRGAWIGWTTRYWHAQKFEIWGYENYYNNGWIKIAEESAYTSNHYLKKILPSGGFTKFKFIFYKASGTSGRMGLSEIYYIHPEATRPYEGLIPYSLADLSDNSIHASNGNVGIGTTAPQSKLAVNGTITAQEVTVTNTGWSDFVFEDTYKLPSLISVESFIVKYKHLPDIPSAKEIQGKGIAMSEMLAKQMQKIEELTLYIIEQNRRINKLEAQMVNLSGYDNSN